MSSYYNQGVQVIIGNGQNFPGTPRISLIPFIQNAYDKGLLNFTVLPPGSISLAEIENISTSKILGRSTAGSGVIEQISIGTGLSLSGGTLSSTVTATPGGSDTQIQYNNAGVFGGSSQLIFNGGATNTLDITGSGATSSTNSLNVKDSNGYSLFRVRNDKRVYVGSGTTGTNALIVGGAGGNINHVIGFSVNNVEYIQAGIGYEPGSGLFKLGIPPGGILALSSVSNSPTITNTFGSPFLNITESYILSEQNQQENSSLLHLRGNVFGGGTTTSTKPTIGIFNSSVEDNNWNTDGTLIGINIPSSYLGCLLDYQKDSINVFRVNNQGNIGIQTDDTSYTITFSSDSNRYIKVLTDATIAKNLTIESGSVIPSGGGSEPFVQIQSGTFTTKLQGMCTTVSNIVYFAGDNEISIQDSPNSDTFTTTSIGGSISGWKAITESASGHIYLTGEGSDIFRQDYGVGSFVSIGNNGLWTAMTATSNGDVYVGNSSGEIYIQTGETGSFVLFSQPVSVEIKGMTTNKNNDNVYVIYKTGEVYRRTGGIGAFTIVDTISIGNLAGIAASPQNDIYVTSVNNSDIYKQTNETGIFAGIGESINKRNAIAINNLGTIYYVDRNSNLWRQFNASNSDLDGGELILSSGTGTGNGESSITFKTGTPESIGTDTQDLSVKMTITGSGNVGIGTSTPLVDALLELNSNAKGFLPPRLLQSEISSFSENPVNEGMLVYNKDTLGYNMWDSTKWNHLDTSRRKKQEILVSSDTTDTPIDFSYYWYMYNGDDAGGDSTVIYTLPEGNNNIEGMTLKISNHTTNGDVLRVQTFGSDTIVMDLDFAHASSSSWDIVIGKTYYFTWHATYWIIYNV